MNNPMSEPVLITHVVNPHQFYFKCASDIGNSEFSKFDFEIQLYGNELFTRQKDSDEHGYVPVENELVIFYNIIYNKWVRGRVVSLGQEITFWCIDNGIWEKLAAPHVLPLTQRFHEDMKLVHLGGLSLVPTEKTLNVETIEVETRLSKQWDVESINIFKRIMDSSTTLSFTEEFQLENHKFGSLVIESKHATKEINKILLAMNKVAPSMEYADEELWNYVNEERLDSQLHQSIVNGSLTETAKSNNNNIAMKTMSLQSIKSGSIMSSIESLAPNEDFDDSLSRQSSSDISAVMESKTKSPRPSIYHRNDRQQSHVVRCENAKETEISKSSKEGKESSGDIDDSVRLTSSPTHNHMSFTTQNILNLINEGGCLRSYKADFTENVRRKPLESTVAWIDSMSKSNSSTYKSCSSSNTSSKDDSRSHQLASTLTTEKAPSATTTRQSKLTALAKKAAESDKFVNKSTVREKLFGIPAGYLKSDLDTFKGMNKN